jgi:flagellar basal body-associated protein FliL
MGAHHEKQQEPRGYGNLTVVALTILVMGLSLAAVILIWVWFGHIGPSFSSETLAQQQRTLRQQYGLPYKPIITDPTVLQTPPSLRKSVNGSNDSNSSTPLY